MNNIKKIIFTVIGSACVIAGAIGAAVPILPTVPFLLLAAYCFAKSSDKLNKWFKNTQLYKNNLDDYVNRKAMTLKSKIMIIISFTAVMGLGFVIMAFKKLTVPCAILLIIWIVHMIYFVFCVKTLKNKEAGL